MIYFGIDTGSSTSKFVIAVLDDNRIVALIPFKQGKEESFSHYLGTVYHKMTDAMAAHCPEKVFVEETYYHGKKIGGKFVPLMSANKRHQRIMGVLMLAVDYYSENMESGFIAPTSVKLGVAGSGKAEKTAVANALLTIVDNPGIIQQLIKEEEFDETDAIAVGIAGRNRKEEPND